jgi:3-oxoadipate enol-lactonase
MKSLLHLIAASALMICPAAQAHASGTPIASQWVKSNGVHLRYELTGKGPETIVLLHEMSVSLESWDYVTPELARDYRVLRYDLRGFGLSERIRGTMTMEAEMADLRGLLESLDIRGKVTLIGGAIGGAIALKFAATYPERVHAVAAISPAAYM